MKRIVTVAISAAFAGFLLAGTSAQAQTASTGLRVAQAPKPASCHGCVRAAAAAAAARADLSAGGVGARRLSALQPRPQRRARLHRDLRAGVPAERHGDHPAHELLLAARLDLPRFIVQRISLREPRRLRGAYAEVMTRCAPGSHARVLDGAAAVIRSCPWRIHSHPIQVACVSLRTASRRCGLLDRAGRRGRDPGDPRRPHHAVNENSGACGRWRIVRARGPGRARECAIAQQSRRRRGGSGRYQAGDDGSALATPRYHRHHRWHRWHSSPSPSSSLAPLVSATAWRNDRTGPLHCGPVFVLGAATKLARLLRVT